MNKELVVYLAFKGAINDTDEYVVLRLEDEDSSFALHNVVIAPHSKLRGSFDGAIFQDGTMVKISAHAPVWVSLRIWKDKKGVVRYTITDGISKVVDAFANTKKFFDSKFRNKDNDYSGVYFSQNLSGAELKGWWDSVMKEFEESLDWKQVFESKIQQQLRERIGKHL